MPRSVHVSRTNPRALLLIVVSIAVLMFAPLAGASSNPSTAELAAITARGRLLAEYDTAAWHATDAVLAAHTKEESSGRYIAHKTDSGWVVDFGRLSTSGDKFLVVHETIQAGEQYTVRSFNPAREDLGWNLAAAKAIETALQDFQGANRPYNAAMLPAEDQGIDVYLYPAQVKEGVYPLGADVRYRISPDGTKITEKRQMHKSIIETAQASTDVKVEAGYYTHVLSDVLRTPTCCLC